MHIKSVSIKNFLSYGEVPIEYIFDRNNMTLITAENGKGKSSIICALTYVLFGKSFRDIKKDRLINSTNRKNMLVELMLIGKNGKNVRIRRGAKPNIFEIYEDDVLVDQHARNMDYQDYLETHIIGMNFITFAQTIIISKTRYTPFMKLKSGERRAFVESILNIEIFGDMQKLQSKRVSALKDEESNLRTDIKINDSTLKTKIESLKRFLVLVESAKKESLEATTIEIERIKAESDVLKREIESLKDKIDNTDYSDEYSKTEKLKTKRTEVVYKIKGFQADLAKMKDKSDKCHVCGSKMDISHVEAHIVSLTESIKSNQSLIGKIDEKIESYKESYDNHLSQKVSNQEIKYDISSKKSLIEGNNARIEKLEGKTYDSSMYDSEISSVKQEARTIKEQLKTQNENLQSLLVDIDNNSFVHTILKDSGIKSSIIQNSIPAINQIINEYLHKFGFFISFELDSEFNETIYFKGVDDLGYNNFSEGEKLRVDLALILAWRQISLLQSGTSCNLLFFDEIVDASMDAEGVDLFSKCLSSLKDTNVWIITHTPEKIENYVRGYIKLDKIDGFTTVMSNK